MPIFLALVGIILIVAGVRGKETELLTLFADDAKHFVSWALLIVVVGAMGFSQRLRPISTSFLVLIVIAFVIASYRQGNSIINGFNQLIEASKS